MYIEKQSASELKLYLTNIQNDDAGEYECRGRVEGNDVKKNSKLLIYGESRGQADRQTGGGLKLYLTNIQNDDAGEYECRGRVEGNDVKKNSKLLIYGEHRGV